MRTYWQILASSSGCLRAQTWFEGHFRIWLIGSRSDESYKLTLLCHGQRESFGEELKSCPSVSEKQSASNELYKGSGNNPIVIQQFKHLAVKVHQSALKWSSSLLLITWYKNNGMSESNFSDCASANEVMFSPGQTNKPKIREHVAYLLLFFLLVFLFNLWLNKQWLSSMPRWGFLYSAPE